MRSICVHAGFLPSTVVVAWAPVARSRPSCSRCRIPSRWSPRRTRRRVSSLATYIYIYVYIYVYVNVYVIVYVNVYVIVYVNVYVNVYVKVYVYVYAYVCVYVNAYIHTYIHTYMHKVNVYVYIYVLQLYIDSCNARAHYGQRLFRGLGLVKGRLRVGTRALRFVQGSQYHCLRRDDAW